VIEKPGPNPKLFLGELVAEAKCFNAEQTARAHGQVVWREEAQSARLAAIQGDHEIAVGGFEELGNGARKQGRVPPQLWHAQRNFDHNARFLLEVFGKNN
jgi:hypothetical protein